MQKQPSKGFFKESVTRNFAEFKIKYLCRNFFFDKVKLWIFNFIKNESLAQVFSCEFCEICKKTFFAEHDRATASDYSSINSSKRRIGKRKFKL